MKFLLFIVITISAFAWAECSTNSNLIKREYDSSGRLSQETFPNGKSIKIDYDENNRVIRLSIDDWGNILYKYDENHLLEVSKISPNDEISYTHSYQYNSSDGLSTEKLISNLGVISYKSNSFERVMQIQSPYSQEIYKFDTNGRIANHSIDDTIIEYQYDNNNQVVIPLEISNYTIEYDRHGLPITKVSPKEKFYFEFDEFGRLIEIISDHAKTTYSYDDFDRRWEKRVLRSGQEEVETYLYFGNNEIAIYDGKGNLKQLRIPGLTFNNDFTIPIAIEIGKDIFAPIHDFRGNIFKLINTKTKQLINYPYIDCFGQNLTQMPPITPWLFASKHYDDETNLVYFGNRYYDPEQKKWLTPDPLGTLQHLNLYLYCLGNPLSYFDPDGQFALSLVNLAWGAGATLSFPFWGTAALVTVSGAAVGWATYEVIQKVKDGNQRDGTPGWNRPQNDQFRDAMKQIEKMIGRKLSRDDERKLHRYISGRNYGYHEIIEEGFWLFHGR